MGVVEQLENALQRIRSVADYQFGKGIGIRLFPKDAVVSYSRRTSRIRYVYLGRERLATMRPTNGLLSLSVVGAKRIAGKARSARCLVKVREDVLHFISTGGDVFAAHVVQASSEIRPKDEVIVVDDVDNVLAVGRAVLSGEEMRVFKRGVAVKIRHGCV